MNIILLSGGSGKRLWPLSNDIRSKQFIKIFPTENGYESMIQRMYRQIKNVDKDARIIIATAKTQVSAIHNQIGYDVGISVEPFRRDTFPAIVLASSYMYEIQKVSEDEVVVVVPVDPYVEEDYFKALGKLSEQAGKDEANLVLMGIKPTYPSEKYGYIIPKYLSEISLVDAFKEKPERMDAYAFIQKGGLWNAGVFAFRIKYILDKARDLLGYIDYEDLLQRYDSLEKISFDYAIAEKESLIQVMRFVGKWRDLGTWNTLTDAMERHIIGDAIIDRDCNNLHVINELSIPILAMGLHDVIISAGPNGILVSDKEQSSYIKPYVDEINQEIMIAEKSWGGYQVLNVEDESLTIRVDLKAGCRMSYHSHQNRDEVWIVISGSGRTIVDGVEQQVRVGNVIIMQAGCKHTVIAETRLKIIEVQIGKEIFVQDKMKFELRI
ncbi:cupin domain-containing protein [bacterium D16-54]|nr:cupin domain-containing protein [bacterium D16-54]RKJ12705.1 cupin domain-containing protein [bacterium D16-56]